MLKDMYTCFPHSNHVKDICHPVSNQNVKLSKQKYKHLQHLTLANNTLESEMSIDILIGSDFYWSIVENETIRGPPGSPVAVESKVGYILSGPTSVPNLSKPTTTLISHVLKCESEFVVENITLNNDLQSFWSGESISDNDVDVHADVHQSFRDDLKFNTIESRYEVKLPFKEEHDLLPDNYAHCEQCLNNLKNKGSKN